MEKFWFLATLIHVNSPNSEHICKLVVKVASPARALSNASTPRCPTGSSLSPAAATLTVETARKTGAFGWQSNGRHIAKSGGGVAGRGRRGAIRHQRCGVPSTVRIIKARVRLNLRMWKSRLAFSLLTCVYITPLLDYWDWIFRAPAQSALCTVLAAAQFMWGPL
jgi:hypothetical protein